ncbi:MAG: hypothetical protein HN522_01145 [Flavobacteriales bacterium]|jgi:hypothetical protein|nr:hypothetical protein [Flavobacteriales bacterium]MBT5089780.1 hypothetical protein [Flavobacteriales bacterium]MBT5750528.1 hypothetical protein [Flavobacteriales bacterium]
MGDLFSDLKKLLTSAISIGIQFLCLGVIVQLLIDEKIMGWDPVGNIQAAGPSFIGVIAFIVLYLLFIRKKAE